MSKQSDVWSGRAGAWLVVVCGVLMLCGAVQAGPTIFSDTFSDVNGTPLNGLRGWATTGAGSGTVVSGRASLQDITLSHAFTPDEHAVNISFTLAPVYAVSPSFPAGSRFKFYVNTNGIVTAYNGATATNLTHTPLAEGVDVTFALQVDYPLERWSLSVAGVPVATDLALSAGDPNSRFEELGFKEIGTNTYSYVDNVLIQRGQTESTFVLPFEEPFNTLTLGNLNTQRDWVSTAATVQGSVTRGGKACSISNSNGKIEHTFYGDHTNVWTQLEIRPLRGNPPSPPSDATFAYYVETNGVVWAYDGTTPTALTGSYVPPDTWVRFMTHSDYANTNWNLYLNNRLIGEDLGFFNSGVSKFTTFAVHGADSSIAAHIDNIYVGESRPSSPGSVFILR
ncbi:MAG: hypothetical protein HN919_19235 [Verrucomicrobia bacterium]|nr:hypothetical protein [Verrucomicrobiota bacterium]MBT7068439.1 hypothetical protein [Verrucomicrobiota bacterium]MBT7698993.1 hypothetical protein [Verrucomicrobiota bacterium]